MKCIIFGMTCLGGSAATISSSCSPANVFRIRFVHRRTKSSWNQKWHVLYMVYIYIFKSRDNYTSQLYYYSMDNSIKQYFLFIYFTGPLSEVQTAVSLEVNLPCDLIPASAMLMQDKVTLVIWYREGNDKPIYTWVTFSCLNLLT